MSMLPWRWELNLLNYKIREKTFIHVLPLDNTLNGFHRSEKHNIKHQLWHIYIKKKDVNIDFIN